MANVIAWFGANWGQVATVIAYVIAIASIVVKLTPTTKDDAILTKIIAFVGKYIALNK